MNPDERPAPPSDPRLADAPKLNDALKLTSYFGERDRAGGRLVGDALLDLYGAQRFETSILVRGTLGFGTGHRLHTDRLLSLSEDLPMVAVAVDRRERIEAALDEVRATGPPGLVTLERSQLVAEPAGLQSLPETLGEESKLTLYLGRRERIAGRPAFVTVCDLLHAHGVSGATALLGVDGTRGGRRQRAGFFSANAEVPTMVIAVGASTPVVRALAAITALGARPLCTLERVLVCKRDGHRLATPGGRPETAASDPPLWQKLTVYTSEAASYEGRPLHHELVRRLRASEVSGATVLRGIWGFHGAGPPHGDRWLSLRRHVPALTIVVDSPPRIARAFALIDELTREHGLVTSELVPTLIRPGR